MRPPLVQINNISKSFDTLQVLKNIELKIVPGEFVSIIGPSGCGKSTLLRIFAGVEKQTSGEIFFDGKNILDRRGLSGFMQQKPLLLPFRNVQENVILGEDIKRIPRDKALKNARKLLSEFGLSEFANVYPTKLSGGMSQKVALLRTLRFNQELLLLDEPFGALDALTRQSLQVWLLRVWQKRKGGVLFVTHDISEAVFLSDRILVMSARPGKIIAEIVVDLKRPRKREQMTNKEALTIEKKLFDLLSE